MKQQNIETLRVSYPQLIRRNQADGAVSAGLFTYEQLSGEWDRLAKAGHSEGKPHSLIPVSAVVTGLIEKEIKRISQAAKRERTQGLGINEVAFDAAPEGKSFAQMQTAKHAFFRKLIGRLVEKDRHTGFDLPFFEMINTVMVADKTNGKYSGPSYAQMPVTVMGMDLSNLMGTNLALSGAAISNGSRDDITPEGEQATDQLLRIIARIVQNHAEKAVEGGGEYRCTRKGGDELSVLFLGIDEAKAQETSRVIEESIRTLVDNLGLTDIAHPKYPSDATRRGLGIGCAAKAYQPEGADPFQFYHDMNNALDHAIENSKLNHARTRKANATAPVNQLDGQAREKAIREIDRVYRYHFGDHATGKTASTESAPMHEGAFRWESLQDRLSLSETMADQQFSHAETDLAWRLFDLIQSRDMETGFKRDSFADTLRAALRSVNAENEDTVRFGAGYTPMVFEVQNMAGMNELLGHEGCNRVVGGIARIIAQEFGDALVAHRPGGRGDKLYLMLPSVAPEMRHAQMQAVTEAVKSLIAEEYPHLAQLPNPRYPGIGYEGVRVVAAACALDGHKGQSLKSVLDNLDESLAANKRDQIIFRADDSPMIDIPFAGAFAQRALRMDTPSVRGK